MSKKIKMRITYSDIPSPTAAKLNSTEFQNKLEFVFLAARIQHLLTDIKIKHCE